MGKGVPEELAYTGELFTYTAYVEFVISFSH
jgi:hypothetical protein